MTDTTDTTEVPATPDTPPLIIACRPLSLSEQHLRFEIRPEGGSDNAIRITAWRANRRLTELSVIHKPSHTVQVCLEKTADRNDGDLRAADWMAIFQEVQRFAAQCQASVMHTIVLDEGPRFRSAVLQRAGFQRSTQISRAIRIIDTLEPESRRGPADADVRLFHVDHIQSSQQLLQAAVIPQSGHEVDLATWGTHDLLELLRRAIRTSTELSDLPAPEATHLLMGWASLDADVRLWIATINERPAGILVTSQPSVNTPDAQPVVLEYVAVDPEFRRQRIATGLICAAIRRLQSEHDTGPIPVTAFVDAGNRSALGLYRHNQFEIGGVGSLWIHRRDQTR